MQQNTKHSNQILTATNQDIFTSIDKKDDDIFDGFGDGFGGGGGGNLRCGWDGSVCTESATHRIVLGFYESLDAEPTRSANVYCMRHYPLELLGFVTHHSEHCPISITKHLISYGEI